MLNHISLQITTVDPCINEDYTLILKNPKTRILHSLPKFSSSNEFFKLFIHNFFFFLSYTTNHIYLVLMVHFKSMPTKA